MWHVELTQSEHVGRLGAQRLPIVPLYRLLGVESGDFEVGVHCYQNVSHIRLQEKQR